MKKSQVSMEFLFAIGIIFFVFLLVLGFTVSRSKELSDSEEELSRREECLLISSLITSAFVSGDGTAINVSLSYNSTINTTGRSFSYKEVDVEGVRCLLQANDVPTVRLKPGNARIENRNGYIDIENE
ncbi:hypothetical protein KY358_05860 [Candidatus Woesearchaeota archaeon]|nr:hypothetical protein [Candidatus Woesearchaeota archaeon]